MSYTILAILPLHKNLCLIVEVESNIFVHYSTHNNSQHNLGRSRASVTKNEEISSKQEGNRTTSQKPGTTKKNKLRDSSRINKGCLNIHITRANMARVSKQSSKSPVSKKNCKDQIKKLMHILSGTKVNSKMSSKRKVGQRRESSSSEYTPYSKSRVSKTRPSKPHKNNYETLVNSLVKKKAKKPIECNFKKYGNEDPYKIIAESSKTRNGIAATSKTEYVGKIFTKEDEKQVWKKYIEGSGELYSMTTNKSSAQIGKVIPSGECKEDQVDSDEVLTVIENDCENNYDLICNTLEGNYI